MKHGEEIHFTFVCTISYSSSEQSLCVAHSVWQGRGMRSKELGNLHRFSLPGSFIWRGRERRTENCHEGLPGFAQEVSEGVVARRRRLDLFGHTGSEAQEEREHQQVNLETVL